MFLTSGATSLSEVQPRRLEEDRAAAFAAVLSFREGGASSLVKRL